MAYSPFVSAPPALTRLLGNAALKAVAARHGATPAQIALAWLLHQPGVVAIPKAVQPAHVRANRAAYDLALTAGRSCGTRPRLPAAAQESAAGHALAACRKACARARASCMTMPMSSPPAPPRFSVIVPLIVGCAQFMHQFDGTMITTALPVMAVSLNEDPLKLNLAITCYLLALAVFVPISGWMADRFGARHVFLAAIAVFTISSVLCGLSGTLAEIVLWRTVQGIGGAMMTPVGRVIVVKSVPRHRDRPRDELRHHSRRCSRR